MRVSRYLCCHLQQQDNCIFRVDFDVSEVVLIPSPHFMTELCALNLGTRHYTRHLLSGQIAIDFL